jgi:hypothetical protein
VAFTLFDLLLKSYERLGQLKTSIATGGGTTSVVDSIQTNERNARFSNDKRDGAVFIVRDAAGLSAAPQGEFALISAFDPATGTYTCGTLTAAVGAGDTYSWAGKLYPLHTMIELCNTALQDIGDLRTIDTTTLDTSSDETELSIATDWKRGVIKIWYQTNTDSSDNQWKEFHGWEYIPAAPGTAGTVLLPNYPESGGKDIMVEYFGPHPTVSASSSVISEDVDTELVIRAVVSKALAWRNRKLQGSDPMSIQFENKAEAEYRDRQRTHPAPRPEKKSKIFILGDVSDW